MKMSLPFYSSVYCFEVLNMDEGARLAQNNYVFVTIFTVIAVPYLVFPICVCSVHMCI